MKIACLSGKGGAGKTLVAVNLAAAAGRATYLDCDVEEPNGRLFWKPQGVRTTVVHALLPEFDAAACTGCKKCVEFCRFHALMYIREKPTVFPEVCHSCGGCQLVCPAGAVTETEKPVGRLEMGTRGDVRVVTGILDPGEASGIPVIREVLKQAEGLTVIDCPPGSACSVMESIMDADLCILVAEPTAFGFHNFQMVYRLASLLGRRCGVVINKEDAPFAPLEDFCRERGLEILARIPYDPELAALAADGQMVWRSTRGRGRSSPACCKRSEGEHEAAVDPQWQGGHRKDHHHRRIHPVCPGPGGGRLRRGRPQPAPGHPPAVRAGGVRLFRGRKGGGGSGEVRGLRPVRGAVPLSGHSADRRGLPGQ